MLRYEKNNSPIKQKSLILFDLQNIGNFFPKPIKQKGLILFASCISSKISSFYRFPNWGFK
jgi:hypothetical protein